MIAAFNPSDIAELRRTLVIYDCALQTLLSRLEILSKDFNHFHNYNPIEHIKGRLKTPESIAEKLNRRGFDVNIENVKYLTDIAGARVICSFSRDIYQIAEILKNQPDISVVEEKDYITTPKPSGYRSFHMILKLPVYLSNKTENVAVEVQIRTEAMDFWASLEHKVRYKYKEHIPKHLSDELIVCADRISEVDSRMFLIHDIINLINQ